MTDEHIVEIWFKSWRGGRDSSFECDVAINIGRIKARQESMFGPTGACTMVAGRPTMCKVMESDGMSHAR